MKFSIKDFFSKCFSNASVISSVWFLQETGNLVTFTEEILNKKLYFLCSVNEHLRVIFSNDSFRNKYIFIALNISLSGVLIISGKIFVITVILDNNISNIMLKHHNILPKRTNFFLLLARQIESKQEFKTNIFE